MRMRVSMTIVLAALLALPMVVSAQSAPAKPKPPAISVTLEYFENNSGIFDVKDAAGTSVASPQFGDELKAGWTVITGKGDVAELKLTHTATIIKVAQNTNFTVSALRAETGGQDVFALAVGKIRTVAGKASTKDQYQIKTQSAVCGVRGSDIVIESIPGTSDTLSTLEGTGWIQNAAGQAIDVAQGFFADAMSSTFQAIQIPADVLSGLQDEMKFIKLDVNDALAANKAYQESLSTPATTEPATTTTTTTQGGTPPAPKKSSFMDGIMAKLRDILGMEIGSVNISGTTWSSVVVQPTFALGSLKMSLYLPIIYNGDMFNTADWYHPLGNDEWSFGTDAKYAGNTWAIVGDVASDLLLKIRYIEWGQQRDPFFFKVGNLNDITIGHGLIMRDFANDADFPSVRRVGVNLGLDFGGFGFEAMVNDAAAPDVLGGRLYFRPIKGFKAALGFSTLVDLYPGKDWNGGAALVGNPLFINPGVDLDLPFFESDAFSIVAFADGAAMLPYFRSAVSDSLFPGVNGKLTNGFALDALYDSAASLPIKNWGVAAGLFGNLIIRDFTWRVEFRDYTGSFVPQFYSSGYERQRSEMMQSVLAYLQNPALAAYNTPTMGVFGEGGITLAKLFSLKLSYFWPWEQDAAGNFTFGDDHFVAKFTLEKGVIPVVNIWGSVAYERTNFVPGIMSGAPAQLFDANTVVSATLNYPVTDNVDVSLLYTTTAHRNADGTLSYPAGGGLLPQMDTTLSITTAVHL
jgi:hypothetical protein